MGDSFLITIKGAFYVILSIQNLNISFVYHAAKHDNSNIKFDS